MNFETTLAKLLEAWQDGSLTEAEQALLLQQLDSDADLRRAFAEQVMMMGAIRASADQNPRWLALFDLLAADENANMIDFPTFEEATMERISPKPVRTWHQQPAVRAMAALIALLLVGSFIMKSRETSGTNEISTVPTELLSRFVAVVVATSNDEGQAAGTYLKPGVISQATGWLTLQTLNGVSVTFDAPFRAELIDHDRIQLNEGRARVRVPEGAEGFKLDSPAFDVVDLGTEFAAVVNADGTGTCRVFEGKADVSLLDSIGEVKRTQRLIANESVRLTPSKQDMQTISEVNSDYPEIKQPPRPLLALPHSYVEDVMGMKPVGYWRFEKIQDHVVRNEVANGLRLQATITASIATETGGNHSGDLTRWKEAEFFQIPNQTDLVMAGDFSISMFAQFEWLQNFALLSAAHYDDKVQGNSFILQSYASFRRSGLNGTGLHAVLRDPPAWDGGVEVYGNTLLRPLHWHHIAATRKGEQITLYLDGAVVGRETAGAMPLDCRQIFIGRLNGNAAQTRMEARGLVGHVDELALFTHALTALEIRKLALTKK